MDSINLWKSTPGMVLETPTITPFIPENKKTDAAVIIFPGGAYAKRAAHEGDVYAEFLASEGITAFVVAYRVHPHRFPCQLLDARRAIRWVRAHAKEYGIDKNKVAVMGSSAGGHLAAMVSTYKKAIDFEGIDSIDREDCMPNAQILCYPVILSPANNNPSHSGSYRNLTGTKEADICKEFDPELNADNNTPPAFIWHTSQDPAVNVINSYRYATALKINDIPIEMHIFPFGRHGLGLAPQNPHINQWCILLINWFKEINWL